MQTSPKATRLIIGSTHEDVYDTRHLETHFAPERNIHSAEQQPNETIDQYVLRLRHLAESCKFAALHDDMLRDRLVLGARDKACRARLFREKECNLAKAIESFQINEATLEQLIVIGRDSKWS